MALTPAQTDSFGGGLNLRDKADAVSDADAIDLLNVEFTDRGSIRQRAGYATFTPDPLTNPPKSLETLYTTGGIRNLVCGCGTRLEALNTSGIVVASATGFEDGIWDFCRYGGPGREVVYAGNGVNVLRKWDGSTWSMVASTPVAGALAVMSVEQGNRMVAGRFLSTTGGPTLGAGTSNPSRVYFSDPADPETWGAANWLDFTPGDGEAIQAIHAWENFVFVFKETKFFRITGASTAAGGTPIFHWDTFDTGAGLASPRAVASDETGVYFMGRDGIFRTTGGDAEHLSGIVEPIFYGGASDYYTGGIINHAQITNCAMGVHEDRVYLGFTAGTSATNNYVLVYDTHGDWWSLYDFPAACFASFRPASRSELVFGTVKDIAVHRLSYTSDAGEAIVSRWRGGWHAFGTPEQKVIRESKVWGDGRCMMSVADDYDPDVLTDAVDMDFRVEFFGDGWGTTTWGGGFWGDAAVRALRPKFRNRSEGGTVFSTSFSNEEAGQSFEISRLSHHLREQRIPSIA